MQFVSTPICYVISRFAPQPSDNFSCLWLDSMCDGTPPPKQARVVTTTSMDPVAFAHLRGACNNLNQVVHSGHLAQSMDAARIAALAEEIKAALMTELAKIAAKHDGG